MPIAYSHAACLQALQQSPDKHSTGLGVVQCDPQACTNMQASNTPPTTQSRFQVEVCWRPAGWRHRLGCPPEPSLGLAGVKVGGRPQPLQHNHGGQHNPPGQLNFNLGALALLSPPTFCVTCLSFSGCGDRRLTQIVIFPTCFFSTLSPPGGPTGPSWDIGRSQHF